MTSIGKAVVDGGTDSIGSHMADESLNRGIETFIIDNLETNSNITKLGGMLQFYNGEGEKRTIV